MLLIWVERFKFRDQVPMTTNDVGSNHRMGHGGGRRERVRSVALSRVAYLYARGRRVPGYTRERVLKAAGELNLPGEHAGARSVIQQQSTLVRIVVSGLHDQFVMQLLGPITQCLARHSLAPLLMDVREPGQMESTLRYLLQYRIAGVIFSSGSPPIRLAREYLRLRVPVAMINRDANLESVDGDNHPVAPGKPMP